MKLPCLTACDFMVLKDYKIGLKFVFVTSIINVRIQHLTCSPIHHHITIHHDIFLKLVPSQVSLSYHPSTFDHTLFHQCSASFKVHPSTPYRRGSLGQNNLFVLCDGVFDSFFKLFLCFHAVLKGYIQRSCKL